MLVTEKIEAVIFDMDGTIIDSEPFWKKAEHEIFSSLGVQLSDKMCQQTQAMTTEEVTMFWYEKYPWSGKKLAEVETQVIDYVDNLIKTQGTEIEGVRNFVCKLKNRGYKIGLATNSPYRLISTVLRKLQMEPLFDAIQSAEYEMNGKPHPAVYISVAAQMNVNPMFCVAFEDSYSGLKAAKLAGMKTVAFLPGSIQNPDVLELADLTITTYNCCDHLL